MTAIATPVTTEPLAPTARRVFLANVRAEWTKLRSVRSTIWTLLAAFGIAVGFGAIVGVSQMSSWDNLKPSERLLFDPTFFSLSGLWLAQLAVGVLGVLVVTSEYATGQIRATLGATPQRLTVLAAKAAAFTAVILATGTVASFTAFWTGPAMACCWPTSSEPWSSAASSSCAATPEAVDERAVASYCPAHDERG